MNMNIQRLNTMNSHCLWIFDKSISFYRLFCIFVHGARKMKMSIYISYLESEDWRLWTVELQRQNQ